MTVRALLVSADLNDLKVANDIISINYRSVEVTKIMTPEKFTALGEDTIKEYDIIIYSLLDSEQGIRAVETLSGEAKAKMILMNGHQSDLHSRLTQYSLPHLKKPFSLDEFSDTVKSVCKAC